jgi:hypothetical protein
MSNHKHFYVSRDPIELIKESGVPLRLQDIASLCHGDRRYILRCIESQKAKERLEMRQFYIDNGMGSFRGSRSYTYGTDFSDDEDSEDYDDDEDDEDFDFDDASEEDEDYDSIVNNSEYPFPDNLAYLYVRKGFPIKLLKDEDFDTIRKKWVVNGHWRNDNPKGYMRLFTTYKVMKMIKAIKKTPLELKPKKGRLYPLIRKSRI